MSSYRIYTGDKKSLVFPILGDGYVHLDYSRHIPKGADGTQANAGIEALEGDDDDDAKYGLWGHKKAFTIEAIATPYDINGFGYKLGVEYGFHSSTGTPAISSDYAASKLGIPFLDKYYSPSGGSSTATNSRTGAYFSHMNNCVLAIGINNSVTTFKVNTIENLIGGSLLRIGREQMTITYIVKAKGDTSSVVVVRGVNGTTAESHSIGATIQSDNRRNHKMTIFHNETCQFYLKNMTRGNMNQPAEYKLGCIMKGKDSNGNIKTVTTESNSIIIGASKEFFSKPIQQTVGAKRVFGKPVFLDRNDRVRYHKVIDVSDNPIYYEREYSSTESISSGNVTFNSSNNTITRTAGTWPAAIVGYIKIKDSGNNDGYYKVLGRSGGNAVITLDSTIWPSIDTRTLLYDETLNAAVTTLVVYYDSRYEDVLKFSNGSAALIDVETQMWMGKNLYSQINSSKIFSTSLEQTEPNHLGFISDIIVNASTNQTNEIRLGVCKLIKPIRTTTETKLYVDDVSNIVVGDMLLIGGNEEVTVDSISGNTLTVTRATLGSARTTSLDAFGLTGGGAGSSNYVTDAREEDNFSKTIGKNRLGKGEWFNGFRTVDADDVSLSNSDLYGGHLLTDTWMECEYVLRPFHLAMAYDDVGQRISLFVDGAEIDASIFSETDFRIHSVVTAGSATATVNTIDKHGLLSGDISNGIWISIKDTSVANLNGVWKVVSIVDDNNFTINVVNSLSSATHTNATVRDVTIRTRMTFDDFEFDATDCYLGSNGNTTLGERRSSQFMGELHEFCITKEYKDSFQSIDTLIPNYRNTLLYFRFEEANL